MKSLLSIFARNLKIIYRSKLSFLLVILAPILIVLLVGTAFSSNSLNDITVGVYSEGYNELTDDIILGLQENLFTINKIDSSDRCINSVEQGNVHACIIFPPEMSFEGTNESVLMYVDSSRLNLAYTLVNQIDSEITEKGSELGIAMADDLLKVIGDVKNSLPEQKTNMLGIKDNLNSIKSNVDSVAAKTTETQNFLNDALAIIEGTEEPSSELNSVGNKIETAISSLEETSTLSIQSEVDEGKTNTDSNIKELNILIESIDTITSTNAENIVMPIKTAVMSVGEEDSSNWKNMFPTLIAMVILLSGIVLASSLVLTERRAKARFRNFMTPTSHFSFVIATFLTGLFILILQMIIFFTGTYYFTQLSILNNIWNVALVLLLSMSVFLALGMLIGYIFKSDETTILVSISIASLLIFFSNTIVPMESISGVFKYFALYNPLFITDSLLKKIILFSEPLSTMYVDLGILAGAFVGLTLLTILARKLTKRMA